MSRVRLYVMSKDKLFQMCFISWFELLATPKKPVVTCYKKEGRKKTSYISTDIAAANCCIIYLVVVWPVYKKCLIFDWRGDTFELLIMMTMTLSNCWTSHIKFEVHTKNLRYFFRLRCSQDLIRPSTIRFPLHMILI